MRISLLLKREPFDRIFEETLSRFLRVHSGRTFAVKWNRGIPNRRARQKGQLWLCNPYLNAIFVPGVERPALRPVLEEFSYSPVPWRRPLQALYVKLATDRLFSCWWARSHILIAPPIARPTQIVILGGNHHIRFHDHSRGRAYVICKAGFDQSMLQKDIHVRERRPYLPCPRILEKSADGSWYSEELILGRPVNRMKDQTKAWAVIRELQTDILPLYQETAEREDIGDYATNVYQFLRETVRRAKSLLGGTFESAIDGAAGSLLNYITRNFKGVTLTTVQSHGDFQAANILAGPSRHWLIDWEYSARRQAAYDPLVLALLARSPDGLSGRIRDALHDRLGNETSRFLLNSPFVDWEKAEKRFPQIGLFLLEDLCLKVQENSNPVFRNIESGLTVLIDEARRALVVLESEWKRQPTRSFS